MYRKFKDCLFKPSRIGLYATEKFSQTLLYFLLLLLIFSLPSLTTLLSIREMPEEYSDIIVEGFYNSESINYEIKDYKLVSTTEEVKKQYADLGYFISLDSNILVFFNLDEKLDINKYSFDDNLIGKQILGVVLESDKMYLISGQIIDSNNEEALLADTENDYALEISYEKLGIKNLDFSSARYNKTTFKQELDNAYCDIINIRKGTVISVGIIGTLILNSLAILFEMVFLAALVKLLYSRYKIKFGHLCKLVLFAYTPQVVFNLLSIFWSSPILYIIGQFLAVIYLTTSIKFYSLNMVVKSVSAQYANIQVGPEDVLKEVKALEEAEEDEDDEEDEDEGDDDNEL